MIYLCIYLFTKFWKFCYQIDEIAGPIFAPI